MIIKRGDILYKFHEAAISDKDYCTDEINNLGFDCGSKDFNESECPNYSKCWNPALKSVLGKVRVTQIVKHKWDKSIRCYNCVHLNSNEWVTREKIYLRDIGDWAKSESAALSKFLKYLKELIVKINNAKGDTGYYFRKNKGIKTYISLKNRIEKKVNGKRK